jgi:hypothetical protein
MNLNNYPLYNILTTELNERNGDYAKILKKGRTKKLAKILSEAKGVNKDSIYLIIKIFNLKNDKVPYLFEPPYNGVIEQTDIEQNEKVNITFDLKNFPDNLVCILQIFAEKYLQ